MTHRSIHRGVEFISEIKDQHSLQAWYDHLPENEVKASIKKIKCAEYRPYDQASFRVIVLCRHPLFDRLHGSESNPDWLNDKIHIHDITALIAFFTDWIKHHEMPDEIMVGKRYAFVDWWPMELIHHALSELSPQNRAQLEMNNHILECLELIRLATISDQAFSELWIGSNEPFFAAGRLVYGDFQWVREVPLDMIRNGGKMQALLERVRECSREYVGLIRLALLTDAESPLLERISLAVQQFNLRYLSEIPSWQRLARDLLDGVVVSPLDPKIANPKVYAEVDAASDELRQDLAEVTVGLESEIVMLINAVLPTLRMPPSSVLFTDKADAKGQGLAD